MPPAINLAGGDARDERADLPRLEPAASALVELLDRVGYFRSTPRERVQQTARTTLQKAAPTVREVEALLAAVRPYYKYFSNSKMQLDLPSEEVCLAMTWSGDFAVANTQCHFA